MRILIDKDNRLDKAYPLPWKSDGTCFNFKSPEIVIHPDNIMAEINEPEKVESLCNLCNRINTVYEQLI
jgi:hypothetical protein